MPAYYLLPKKLVEKLPFLKKAAWWFEAAFFWILLKAVRLVRFEWSSALLSRVFAVVGPHTGKASKVLQNLAFVRPGADRDQRLREVKRVFANLGHAAAELVFMDRIWAERDSRLEFIADRETESILRAGKPAVLVTAHVGAWQLANLVGAHYGLSISTIYARESNPYLAALFYRLRTAFRTRLVASEGSVRPLLRELQQGNSVGLAVDTRLDTGEMIPFFGVPAPTNTVPARLALRTGAPLVPVRAERLGGGHFRITAYPPIEPEDPKLPRDQQALAMSRRINALFEQWIGESPEEWMCLKRRWPKTAQPAIRGAAHGTGTPG